MSIQVPRYESILRKEKELSEANIQSTLKIEQAKLQQKVSDLDIRIMTQERCINNMLQEKDLDLDAIVNAQEKLSIAQMRKESFEGLVAQLFPAN